MNNISNNRLDIIIIIYYKRTRVRLFSITHAERHAHAVFFYDILFFFSMFLIISYLLLLNIIIIIVYIICI